MDSIYLSLAVIFWAYGKWGNSRCHSHVVSRIIPFAFGAEYGWRDAGRVELIKQRKETRQA